VVVARVEVVAEAELEEEAVELEEEEAAVVGAKAAAESRK
jgi:hypothetical protein